MPILLVAAGGGLVVLVLVDAAVTTLWVASAGGPLTSRLGRRWWSIAHRFANRPTSRLLTSAGPLILLMTITVWLALLWLGWTMVFAADSTAVVSSSTQRPADWGDRVYFAGFTMFTLGVGDFVPVGTPWQVATVVATVTGLGVTTLAITYLVPVVTAATERGQQASSIAALGGQAHRIVLNAYDRDRGSVRYLEPVLHQLTDGLRLTAERHFAYPILHFFHPGSLETELRIQVAELDDALTLVQHGLDPAVDRPHPAAVDGARRAIDQILERAGVPLQSDPPPLSLDPLAGQVPVVLDGAFARQVDQLEERRRRVAGYAAESGWARPPPPPDAGAGGGAPT